MNVSGYNLIIYILQKIFMIVLGKSSFFLPLFFLEDKIKSYDHAVKDNVVNHSHAFNC